MFHKNISNMGGSLANGDGRSRMITELAVGHSQQENRINIFHENFMQSMRKNNNTSSVLAPLDHSNS